jgi:hypothetical protein
MPVRLHHIVIDAHDLPALARFWTEALGWKVLDLTSSAEDRDQETDRLLALGARRIDIGQTGNESWTVLADPEGNEFCVVRPKENAHSLGKLAQAAASCHQAVPCPPAPRAVHRSCQLGTAASAYPAAPPSGPLPGRAGSLRSGTSLMGAATRTASSPP